MLGRVLRRDPELRRGDGRPVTRAPGIRAAHSLSFGRHYESANTSFGELLALNDELLQPGAGYAEHPHRGVELVTWVVSGRLLHTDAQGGRVELGPGSASLLSAGSGIRHAETCPRESAVPVRFVQTWLVSDEPDGPPAQASATPALPYGRWVTVAAGATSRNVLPLRNSRAALLVARLRAGEQLRLPECPQLSLLAVAGRVELAGFGQLQDGDEARLAPSGEQRLCAVDPAELLAWVMTDSP